MSNALALESVTPDRSDLIQPLPGSSIRLAQWQAAKLDPATL